MIRQQIMCTVTTAVNLKLGFITFFLITKRLGSFVHYGNIHHEYIQILTLGFVISFNLETVKTKYKYIYLCTQILNIQV